MDSWQFLHEAEPYGYISQDSAQALFARIRSHGDIPQGIFLGRALSLTGENVLAYECTALSALSGCAGENNGLQTERVLVFYSAADRQSLCFQTEPGEIPVANAVKRALRQLGPVGIRGIPEIVTGSGCASEEGLSALLRSSCHFITPVRNDLKGIRPLLDRALEELGESASMCGDEPGTYATTVYIPTEFQKHLYMHVYCNDNIRIRENQTLDEKLYTLRAAYVEGQRDFTADARDLMRRCLRIRD